MHSLDISCARVITERWHIMELVVRSSERYHECHEDKQAVRINQSINQSIHPSIHPSIHQSDSAATVSMTDRRRVAWLALLLRSSFCFVLWWSSLRVPTSGVRHLGLPGQQKTAPQSTPSLLDEQPLHATRGVGDCPQAKHEPPSPLLTERFFF